MSMLGRLPVVAFIKRATDSCSFQTFDGEGDRQVGQVTFEPLCFPRCCLRKTTVQILILILILRQTGWSKTPQETDHHVIQHQIKEHSLNPIA